MPYINGTYIEILSGGLISEGFFDNSNSEFCQLTDQWQTVTIASDGRSYKIISATRPANTLRSICIVPYESNAQISVGDGTVAFTVPAWMNGYDLRDVEATVHTKGVTGSTNIQVRRRREGINADMLNTPVTIGDEYSAHDEAVNTNNSDLQTGDCLYVDIDSVHSGTRPYGLSVTLTVGK